MIITEELLTVDGVIGMGISTLQTEVEVVCGSFQSEFMGTLVT
ncbi:MAG: hypothetical protein ACKOX6_09965 [Bdellovibrio sp.]